jgi:NTE family protein
MIKLPEDNSKIGIALGSGSSRGWAHIGVLQALADMGVQPGIVAGSSIGALVGAAYASKQLDEMENWVSSLSWKDLLGFMDFSLLEGGILGGEKIINFLGQCLGGIDIESLPVLFAAVATDLNSGREVWLRKGDLLESVHASIALPGLFAPVRRAEQWLVDGGLVDPVPVSLCRAMGAEIVIAVNLNGGIASRHADNNNFTSKTKPAETTKDMTPWTRFSYQISTSLNEQKEFVLKKLLGESRDTPGIFDVMSSAINIMQDRITRSRMAGDPPDILLTPHLEEIGLLEFDQAAVTIAEGRASVERMLPLLEHVLKKL